jgi:sugar O-acyltransferase (sialic acid O-acetyltransferase NeuD family)
MKHLVIIGAGGFGREVLAWARQSDAHGRDWLIKGFIDDRSDALDGLAIDAALLGRAHDYQPEPDDVFVCAVGQPATKRHLVEVIAERGGRFVSVVHRSAVIGENCRLGAGSILCPYAIVTCNVEIGDHVAINLHSSVAHDSKVGNFSQINCHCDITGWVTLGESVFVGSHASILPKLEVGEGAYIGAGSVVARRVAAGERVFGVPARTLNFSTNPADQAIHCPSA